MTTSALVVPPYDAGAWIINRTVQLKSLLGVGGYACVYHAVEVCVHPPAEYAVKVVMHSADETKGTLLKREIQFHTAVSGSPNVVAVRRIVREDDRTFIFMDLCRGGDLFSAISLHKRFLGNDALLKHVFLQIIDAVMFCHKRKIYHRDLKPENILFTDDSCSTALLTDFGLATSHAYSSEFRFGSLMYMAPECYTRDFLMESRYSSKHSDIWALGVLLLNMVSNRIPWDKAHQSDVGFSEYRIVPETYFLRLFPITDQLNRLLLRIFQLDYMDRISLVDMRSEIACMECFCTDPSDYFVDQYVVDFPVSIPSSPYFRGRISAEPSAPELEPHLLAEATFASTGATPFSPASASESASQPDYFFATNWRAYATPPASDGTPSPPRSEAQQVPSPVHSLRRIKTKVALHKVPRRRVHRIDQFNLPVHDSDVEDVDDESGQAGLRSCWSRDSDSDDSTCVVHSRHQNRMIVCMPTPPPSPPQQAEVLPTAAAAESASRASPSEPQPQEKRRTLRSWWQKPLLAIQKRRAVRMMVNVQT